MDRGRSAGKVGDDVELSYYSVGTMRQLEERTGQFKVGGIIAMNDPRSDITLMPDFPGMTDSENCADWDTGFPMDLDAIRDKDEDYWDTYKGTPKAYISLATGQEIWSNRFGSLTAVRYAQNGSEAQEALGKKLLANITPTDAGLTFQPARSQAAASVDNAMDFGQLFMSFSFFLIAAAVMLISLPFQFTMEKRTRETGTLLAVGIPAKARAPHAAAGGRPDRHRRLHRRGRCRDIFCRDTAQCPVHQLEGRRRLGHAHVSQLQFRDGHRHVDGLLRRARHHMVVAPQTQKTNRPRTPRRGDSGTGQPEKHSQTIHDYWRRADTCCAWLNRGCTGRWRANVTQLILRSWGDAAAVRPALASARLKRLANAGALGQSESLSLRALGQRNAARRSRRSMATIGMLACGSFMIASIGVFQKDAETGADQPTSGTGGFELMGEASIAIVHDMNNPTNREDFYSIDEEVLKDVSFVPFRLRDGRPGELPEPQPRAGAATARGAPGDIGRQVFFIDTMDGLKPGDNPWSILESAREALKLPADVVPAIADQSVMMWALSGGDMMKSKKLGDTIDYTDEHGNAFKIQFVGQIADSIMQGNLIIPESDFIKRFPSESGYRVFLVDNPGEQTDEVNDELNVALADHGFEWVSTTRRLGDLNAVQNTYLQTFQVLGGLGLLIGSLGLGVVVLRNVQERKSELALLRAVGFEKSAIKRFVLSEYLGLLVGGLFIGTVAAALAVLPTMLSPTADVLHALLGATLGGVLLFAGFGRGSPRTSRCEATCWRAFKKIKQMNRLSKLATATWLLAFGLLLALGFQPRRRSRCIKTILRKLKSAKCQTTSLCSMAASR